jgi:hypothetical protein
MSFKPDLDAIWLNVDFVLDGLVLVAILRAGQRGIQRGGRLATLTGMGLIDNDREAAVAMLCADVTEDEREFLHRGDDDLIAVGDEAAQAAGMLSVPHDCAHLRNFLMVWRIC